MLSGKVLYLETTCEFCEYIFEHHPDQSSRKSELVSGRAYTVSKTTRMDMGGLVGYGVKLVEYDHPLGWYHCSCNFREIDGDADAWSRIVHASRPKELQPA
jgi:hypothetical protein